MKDIAHCATDSADVSHVIMSSLKLINRIKGTKFVDHESGNDEALRSHHHATYGISSDTMLHFAVAFSVLIHDVDHTGLANAELNSMHANSSTNYRGKSVAEQNSVDIAWDMLMEDDYKDLRGCIYTNVEEFHRFRYAMRIYLSIPHSHTHPLSVAYCERSHCN